MIELAVSDASASTIWRWLHDDALKPWQTRSWIYRRDPDFAANAARVLDLYARVFEGRRLWPNEYVICADEKSQLQALGRRHETSAPAPNRPIRSEFEYQRGGTLAYLAASDVHHANLFDRVEPKTGIEPLGRLVEQVMTAEPYASARTVDCKALTPNDLATLDALAERLLGFAEHYRQIARPFQWTFTQRPQQPNRPHRPARATTRPRRLTIRTSGRVY